MVMLKARSAWANALRVGAAIVVCAGAFGVASTSAPVAASSCALGVDAHGTGLDGHLLMATAIDGDGGVWSVGAHFDGGHGVPLVLRSSGSGWTSLTIRLRRNEDHNATLQDVAVLSAKDAWAVGTTGPGRSIVVRWNGHTFRTLGLSEDLTAQRELLAVAAVSPSDVWAVGKHTSGPEPTTLIDHWDGTTWREVASPSQGTESNVLKDVVAVGPSDVWAVGFRIEDGMYQTLAEHWDGTRWRIVDTPDVGGSDSFLMGVAATGSDDVWAVGWSGRGSESARALALHYDGARWSIEDVPSPSATRTQLMAVTAVPGGVLAVGHAAGKDLLLKPFALRTEGNGWTRTLAEPVAKRDASLLSVAASGQDVVAVGSGQFESGYGSVTERGC
jgi:hypothetical protein